MGKQAVFCSRSCAAKFNNKLRVRTEESKLKTAKALITHGRSSRFAELRPVKIHVPNGGMNYCRYEEKLVPLMAAEYGEVRKEMINGIAIDFANDSFLIEFTFDHTAGISSIIKRFSKIDDHRQKIAYVPFITGFGRKRLGKLIKLNIKVLDSMQFHEAVLDKLQSKYD
jgi:hypothetical protein